MKGLKESQIRFIETANLADSRDLRGHSSDSPAEGETPDFFRVITEEFEHFGMDHSSTDDGDPACTMTGAAPFTVTVRTGDVHAQRWFCIGVVFGFETVACLITEKRLNHCRQGALEMPKSESPIDPNAFELVKHGQVGGIDGFISVNPAGARHSDGE